MAARAAVAALLLLVGGIAWAQAGSDCRLGGSVAEINACAVRDFQQSDSELQVLYGDVMRALSAHERPALRQNQTAWQRDRVARCKAAQRSAESQPEWPRLYHECMISETRGRRAGLMHWLQHGEPPLN